MRFRDRDDAGRQLAERLSELPLADPVVLALPRGGVPVAAPVAVALSAPLDVLVVRKVGAPGRPELGVGAIAEGLVEPVVSEVAAHLGLSLADVRDLARGEQDELARRVRSYRDGRQLTSVADRDVVLVDDGLATGVTAEAGLLTLRAGRPRSLYFAAPICADTGVRRLAPLCSGVVHVFESAEMRSVGEWYDDFTQTSDAEVLAILAAHR